MLTIASNQPPNEPLTYCTSKLAEVKFYAQIDPASCGLLGVLAKAILVHRMPHPIEHRIGYYERHPVQVPTPALPASRSKSAAGRPNTQQRITGEERINDFFGVTVLIFESDW